MIPNYFDVNSPAGPNNWTDEGINKTINFNPLPTNGVSQFTNPTELFKAASGVNSGISGMYPKATVMGNTGYVNKALNNRLSDIPGGFTNQEYQMPYMAPAGDRPMPRAGVAGVMDRFKERFPNAAIGMQEDWSGVVGAKDAVMDQGINKMSFGEKGNLAISGATALYGAYNAYKANKMAKEQFNFTKDSFNKNFNAQAKTTNAALSDRQKARVARDPNQHTSVKDYMNKYGV